MYWFSRVWVMFPQWLVKCQNWSNSPYMEWKFASISLIEKKIRNILFFNTWATYKNMDLLYSIVQSRINMCLNFSLLQFVRRCWSRRSCSSTVTEGRQNSCRIGMHKCIGFLEFDSCFHNDWLNVKIGWIHHIWYENLHQLVWLRKKYESSYILFLKKPGLLSKSRI